jgi:hypothetical protein
MAWILVLVSDDFGAKIDNQPEIGHNTMTGE